MRYTRDCLTPILWFVLVMLGIASVTVGHLSPQPKHPVVVGLSEQRKSEPQFAHAGEWVTRPDGRKVCRLTRDLYRNQILTLSGLCEKWQETAPIYGQTVDGWIRSDRGYHQIMIEGEWRP